MPITFKRLILSYYIKNKLEMGWGESKRRETSRVVRRLLQLIIHARENDDLDQSDLMGVLKMARF